MGRAVTLDSRDARRRLAPRHAPYWRRVAKGTAVGYRRGDLGGQWYIRQFVAGRYLVRAVGRADDAQDADGSAVLSWRDALQRALDPAAVALPDRAATRTVAEAAARYFEHRRARSQSPGSLAEDRARFATKVAPELGDVALADLTTSQLRGWLAGLVTAAGETDGEERDQDAERERHRRLQATANRTWTILRAMLNFAFREGEVATDAAWRRVRPFENTDGPRQRFLATKEVAALLRELDPALRDLALGSLYTGLRLGELLALRAEDAAGGRVHVRHSKSGRARFVPLNKEGRRFFARLTAGRPGDTLAFSLEDSPARRVNISRAMRAACAAAKIAPATFHDLRRTYGSLLLNAGAPLDHIRVALGHADQRMTARTYAHLTQDALAASVEARLPSFRARRRAGAKEDRR